MPVGFEYWKKNPRKPKKKKGLGGGDPKPKSSKTKWSEN